jgi:hypothetical protein
MAVAGDVVEPLALLGGEPDWILAGSKRAHEKSLSQS